MKNICTVLDHCIFPSPDRGVLDSVSHVRMFAVLDKVNAVTPVMLKMPNFQVHLTILIFSFIIDGNYLVGGPSTLQRCKGIMVENNQSLLWVDERLRKVHP